MNSQWQDSLRGVEAAPWNELVGAYPFLRHEFLTCLERTACIGPESGWVPRYLLVHDDGQLVGAVAAFEKLHSWGEFVFDFSWAQAAESAGIRYYPKLVVAAPFTPATGPRLLVDAARPDADTIRRACLQALLERAERQAYSSVHALFLDEAARAAAEAAGGDWLLRRDCHFQWFNRGYGSFDAFLETFSADKRKKARRERRRIQEQGIEFTMQRAGELDAPLLQRIYRFHADTFERHGHVPYLTPACFEALARAPALNMIVALARREGRPIAAAVFFQSDDTLYGRYWGAEAEYHSLHFETCYYQGIEWCIRHGLARFEPGTQGEHKVARGFVPTATWSAHWIAHPGLRRAVAAYLRREGQAVEAYAAEVGEHVPPRRAHVDLP